MQKNKPRLATSLAIASLAVLAACARQPEPGPVLATNPTLGQEIGAAAANKLDIAFPLGGTTLTAEARRQLDIAARLYRDVNPVEMLSLGYTDGVGDEFSNVILAARRARAVKAGLVARGIPSDRVRLQALGESDPANTSDPAAAENRRVTIRWRVL